MVLFNRPYQTDIDIERMEYVSARYSATSLPLELLCWTASLRLPSGNISYAVSGGVHSGEAVVKSQALAGARAVGGVQRALHGGRGRIASARHGGRGRSVTLRERGRVSRAA